jgi:hypothetical protein
VACFFAIGDESGCIIKDVWWTRKRLENGVTLHLLARRRCADMAERDTQEYHWIFTRAFKDGSLLICQLKCY